MYDVPFPFFSLFFLLGKILLLQLLLHFGEKTKAGGPSTSLRFSTVYHLFYPVACCALCAEAAQQIALVEIEYNTSRVAEVKRGASIIS